jgi:lipoyl(octanoyl) transferase
LDAGDIPVINIDRGGQVTYHGPGQWVAYILYDLRRAGMNVRELVERLEMAVIDLLADHGIAACGDPAARGVYVQGRKIAALGLKVSRGRSYHGLSLNVDMDLAPFSGINPCGYEGLEVTSVAKELGVNLELDAADLGEQLLVHLEQALSPRA